MNNEMAESQSKESASLKSKIEELKKIWKIDEAIKQPPPKEVDLINNEGIAFRAPIEVMRT